MSFDCMLIDTLENHHRLKGIWQSKQKLIVVNYNYHVGLPMCRTDGIANIRQSRFHVSLMLLPGLWHRRKCLDEKQSAVGSLVFGMLATGVKLSKSCHNYTTKHCF